jgi:DNA-binding transcriptional regulator YiaG
MSAAELHQAIAVLTGGNQSEFARVCGVNGRTVRRWVAGDDPVPKLVQVLIRAWSLLPPAEQARVRQEAGTG